MHDTRKVSISFLSSDLTFEQIDKRAKELGFDRSKYFQKLCEVDLKYGTLSDNRYKKRLDLFQGVILLFLIVILSTIFTLIWLIL